MRTQHTSHTLFALKRKTACARTAHTNTPTHGYTHKVVTTTTPAGHLLAAAATCNPSLLGVTCSSAHTMLFLSPLHTQGTRSTNSRTSTNSSAQQTPTWMLTLWFSLLVLFSIDSPGCVLCASMVWCSALDPPAAHAAASDQQTTARVRSQPQLVQPRPAAAMATTLTQLSAPLLVPLK
jgi:hypothetical protein